MKKTSLILLLVALSLPAISQDSFEFECMNMINTLRSSTVPQTRSLSEVQQVKKSQPKLVWDQNLANIALKAASFYKKEGMNTVSDSTSGDMAYYIFTPYSIKDSFIDETTDYYYNDGSDARKWAGNPTYTKIGIGWSYGNDRAITGEKYRYVYIILK